MIDSSILCSLSSLVRIPFPNTDTPDGGPPLSMELKY